MSAHLGAEGAAGRGGVHSRRETGLGCSACLTEGKDGSLLIFLGTMHVRGEICWYYRTRNLTLDLGDVFSHQQKETWEETFSNNGDQKNVTNWKDVFEFKTRI